MRKYFTYESSFTFILRDSLEEVSDSSDSDESESLTPSSACDDSIAGSIIGFDVKRAKLDSKSSF